MTMKVVGLRAIGRWLRSVGEQKSTHEKLPRLGILFLVDRRNGYGDTCFERRNLTGCTRLMLLGLWKMQII